MTTTTAPRSPLHRRAAHAVGAALACLALAAEPAAAQQRGMTIIRDTEVEALLREYAQPIFRVSGMQAGAVQIILVGDRGFNAFVANGRRIFINTGALLDAKTPNEIIGVLAHETGHIAGGHLSRLRQELANAQIFAVAGMLLGAGAVVGAARGGSQVGNSGLGAGGIMMGSQELVRRNLLAYQRGEEQAADRAALTYLQAMKQSPRGMLTTFKRFAESGLFSSRSLDPYLLSHPLPQERIANLQATAEQSPYYDVKDPPALQARHDMMRAKLAGFMERPETVARLYAREGGTLPARYAIAIANYRNGRLSEALSMIDGLIGTQPANPYFHELKGQALLEAGRAREALVPLRRAVALAPNAALIRIMLGHALVSVGDSASVDEAIKVLIAAGQREPDAPDAFRHLATAYGKKGDIANAELASAQFYFKAGQIKDAQNLALRARDKFKPGTPGYLKADDIFSYVPPKVD